jgi:hypothetical protein
VTALPTDDWREPHDVAPGPADQAEVGVVRRDLLQARSAPASVGAAGRSAPHSGQTRMRLDGLLNPPEPGPHRRGPHCQGTREPTVQETSMSIRNRTVTVISGAALATALVGVAAFAAVDTSTTPATMSDMPAHMAELDPAVIAEMQTMLNEGASVGEMHRFMVERGVDLGRMHGDMSRAGMNPGSMHRNMAPGR